MVYPEAILERPVELVPVLVTFETANSMDYIAVGLVDVETLMATMRSGKAQPIALWDARCVIRYNMQSGSLYGLASTGPVDGGYGVTLSPPTIAPVIGRPCIIQPIPEAAWQKLKAWRSVGE